MSFLTTRAVRENVSWLKWGENLNSILLIAIAADLILRPRIIVIILISCNEGFELLQHDSVIWDVWENPSINARHLTSSPNCPLYPVRSKMVVFEMKPFVGLNFDH